MSIRLLSDSEQENLKNWKYRVEDKSITTKLLTGFWNEVVTWVPDYVAPNVLSLSGLLLIVYSYYLTFEYSAIYPRIVAFLSAILIFGYQTLDAIDGKHARATKNSSPLGELFDHACDSVGTVFIILTIASHLGVKDTSQLFYVTQAGLFLFLMEHLDAFRSNVVEFNIWTGPGEIILGCIAILLIKAFTGYSLIPESIVKSNGFGYAIVGLYWICYLYSFYKIWSQTIRELFPITLKKSDIEKPTPSMTHIGTHLGLTFCLSMRLINGILLYFDMISDWQLQDVVAHALVLSVVISDMIVAKMAKRELHPIIVVGSMLTMVNHDLFTFMLVASYFMRIFYEICRSQKLYLFTPSKNVYICGVFDLTHFGHMRHFQEAAKFGNRLIVGVHSDKDVESYKRIPTLNLEERVESVGLCNYVSEVIPNAPLNTTQELIDRYNIHVVGCSEEYDSDNDEYYRVPRELGILKVIPRTQGISTSNLRKRVFDSISQNKKEN